jgi:UV DNA damage endonuclease
MLRFVPSVLLGSPQVALRASHQHASPTWSYCRALFAHPSPPIMASKRKRSSGLAAVSTTDPLPGSGPSRPRQRTTAPLPSNNAKAKPQPPRRQPSRNAAAVTNPNANPEILDGLPSLRASPDAASETPGQPQPARTKRKKAPQQHVKVDSAEADHVAASMCTAPSTDVIVEAVGVAGDPENDDAPGEIEDEGEITEALSRPPPVNSDYLPLPWKGRLGYVRGKPH